MKSNTSDYFRDIVFSWWITLLESPQYEWLNYQWVTFSGFYEKKLYTAIWEKFGSFLYR